MSAVVVADLLVEYRDGNRTVRPLDGFVMEAHAGQLVLLVGPSGSGKTSLLSCLAGILSPTAGSIRVNDVDVTVLDEAGVTSYRRHTVGVVFQAFNLVPSLTAAENVAAPLLAAGVSRREALARATTLLNEVDLSERMEHRPGQLSGGQQQRVAIARALAFDPPVLLADEPTAHLDHAQAEIVLRILRRLTASGRVVIVSTHDTRLVPMADAVVDLAPATATGDGERRRVELAPGEVLFRQGDASDLVWIVRSGEVAIESEISEQASELLATCGEGSYFGELGPLLGFPRSATARATKKGATVEGYSIRAFRDALGDEAPESWGALAETQAT